MFGLIFLPLRGTFARWTATNVLGMILLIPTNLLDMIFLNIPEEHLLAELTSNIDIQPQFTLVGTSLSVLRASKCS